MKKAIPIFALLLVIGISCALCITFAFSTKTGKKENKQKETNEVAPVDPVLEKLQKMSLEEKIGQMIFIAHRATDYENGFFDEVKDYQPGGFILFKENITTSQEVKKLNQKLQSLSKIPLFIGTDQEGGRVQRFKTTEDQNFTIIPPMEEVGKTNDTSVAYEIGKILGSELNTLGINVDFAPDLDINSNPENTVIGNRSFGTSKELVAQMGLSLAKGIKETGVIPVYKHFPGHGDTYEDSHNDFANIYKTKEELMETELYPFRFAAKEEDAMIMIGHLSLPNMLGEQTPATMSSTMIDLLKKELGFQGITITDALDMGALTNHYSEEEIIINVVKAGIDILLMPPSISNTVTILKKAVKDGTIQEAQIDASVLKILRLKEKYHLIEKAEAKALDQEEWQAHQNYINSHF